MSTFLRAQKKVRHQEFLADDDRRVRRACAARRDSQLGSGVSVVRNQATKGGKRVTSIPHSASASHLEVRTAAPVAAPVDPPRPLRKPSGVTQHRGSLTGGVAPQAVGSTEPATRRMVSAVKSPMRGQEPASPLLGGSEPEPRPARKLFGEDRSASAPFLGAAGAFAPPPRGHRFESPRRSLRPVAPAERASEGVAGRLSCASPDVAGRKHLAPETRNLSGSGLVRVSADQKIPQRKHYANETPTRPNSPPRRTSPITHQ